MEEAVLVYILHCVLYNMDVNPNMTPDVHYSSLYQIVVRETEFSRRHGYGANARNI